MTSCSSLSMNYRIEVSYFSIVSASLSAIGSIGTIILIKIRNKRQNEKIQIQRKQQLSINNSSINGGSGNIVNGSTSLSSYNLNSILAQPPVSFPSLNNNNNNTSSNNNNTISTSISPILLKNNSNQKTKVSHFIINLSIANLISSIFLFVSKIMTIHFNSTFIASIGPSTSTANHSFNSRISACTIGNGIVGFSLLSTFFWTLAISMYIHQQFSNSSKNISTSSHGSRSNNTTTVTAGIFSNKATKIIFYCFCWVIPFLLGLILVSGSTLIDEGSDMPWCAIDSNIQLVAFYVPLMICMVFTIVYTCMVRYKYSPKSSGNAGNILYGGASTSALIRLQSKIIKRLIQFLVIFLICWVPNLISFFVSYASSTTDASGFTQRCKQFLWLEIIVYLLFPLQGCLNFLSYAFSFKKFKSFFSKNNNKNNSNSGGGGFGASIFYSRPKSVSKISSNNFYFTFSTFDLNEQQNSINDK